MKSSESRKFKNRTTYYGEFICLLLLFMVFVVGMIDTLITPEQEFVERILNRDLTGDAHHMRNILIEKFLVSNFGKAGMQAITIIGILWIVSKLRESISAYRRLLFREKLIREGLRAPDDYVDDYVRVPLWKKIINLFAIKRKKKYPSESEMRESLKKNKYYKE